MENKVDICIIGAGWSGILAGKYALENGFSIVLLEQRDEIGGVFNYTDDLSFVTVMKNTLMSSSACLSEASDFPMDKSYGNFLHQTDVKQYLKKYAEHFNVSKYIRFNKQVTTVKKEQDKWTVACQTGETFQSKYLIVSSGVHQHKRDVNEVEEIRNFTGKVLHSGSVKNILPADYTKNDTILVYGGGETASDVIELVVKTPAKVIWSIPNGQHFFRKTSIIGQSKEALGSFDRYGTALDEASSKAIQYITPFKQSKPGMQWICRLTTTGSVLSYDGHGVPEWKINAPLMHAFINKNAHVIDFVFSKRVMPKGKASSCEGENVKFHDGDCHHVSTIILCSGYHHKWPFLPEEYTKRAINQHYKFIFNPDDPTILFIGFARPTITSIPMMTELQCFYAFKILSGKVALPNKKEMERIIEVDKEESDKYFYYRRRPPTLVDPFTYVYDLAKLAGINPNYFKLFLKNPIYFFKTFFSPLNTAQFLLNDPNKQKAAVEQIWRRQKMVWFLAVPILITSRLFCVDRILAIIMKIKYKRGLKKQKSRLYAQQASMNVAAENE